MRQGRVWKKHPLGAVGLPRPAEPALHETRLSLGLQSNAPPPSNPRERTIPRRREETRRKRVTHGHVVTLSPAEMDVSL
jgi:hypothetical protein